MVRSNILFTQAGVMLEYSYEEAKKVLSENLADSKRLMEKMESELDDIKEKLTTIEVSKIVL